MQRSLVLALSILMVATISVPANAGHPSNCQTATGGTVIIPIAAAFGGSTAGFVPNCIVVESGTVVTWRNDDTTSVCSGSTCFAPHDVESGENTNAATHGACFRYSSAPPKGTGDSSQMQFGEKFFVQPTYEHNGYGYLNVSTSKDGVVWSAPMNCSSTIHWSESNTTHATIKYQCHVHHGMQARLVVNA